MTFQMSRAARVFAAVLLVIGLAPEVRRYRAERKLRMASSAVQALVADTAQGGSRLERLERASADAVEASRGLDDSRPWIVAGSAQLIARRPADAIAAYQRGHALGERAEIHLNLGRAYMMLGRRAEAERELLRATWVNPALASSLPDNVASILLGEVRRLEGLLREGKLKAPPR